jgi:hypothetical protein
MRPVKAHWCDPLLADRVLTIEMWCEARNYAKDNMEPGEFYLLQNARIKIGADYYAVGTISEFHKSRKLSESNEKNNVHLGELLRFVSALVEIVSLTEQNGCGRRKKEWKESVAALSKNGFEHLLLKEIDPSNTTFLNCTVVVCTHNFARRIATHSTNRFCTLRLKSSHVCMSQTGRTPRLMLFSLDMLPRHGQRLWKNMSSRYLSERAKRVQQNTSSRVKYIP